MSNLTRGQKILAHIKVLQKFIQEPEVIELRNNDNEKYNELLSEKFSQLKNNNEQLFKIASSHVLNEEEYDILHMMLYKIDKIDNNEITEKDTIRYKRYKQVHARITKYLKAEENKGCKQHD